MTKNNNSQLSKMNRPLLIDKVNRGEKKELYYNYTSAK